MELTERTDIDGHVLTPAATTELPEILELFKHAEVEAIAVCFLHAYPNPANELATLEAIRALWPDVTVVGSHAITREWREYERTSTTVLSAYVKPVAARYLHSLASKLRVRGVTVAPFIMQSNGGIGTLEAACANPISMVESGPASGVLGAIELGRLLNEPRIVSLDIGGTTAKCALINELRAPVTTDYSIEKTPTTAGYPIKIPVIELVEIGSGGGSIARIDEGGKLHVGPESAGAVPGLAVFGRGGMLPTTTDAQVLTGRLDPNNLLGGEITSDLESCERAFEPLVNQLDLSLSEVARGVLRLDALAARWSLRGRS